MSDALPRRVYFKDRSHRLVTTQDELDEALKEGAQPSPACFGHIESPHRYAPGDEPPEGAEIDPVTGRPPVAAMAGSREEPVPVSQPDAPAAGDPAPTIAAPSPSGEDARGAAPAQKQDVEQPAGDAAEAAPAAETPRTRGRTRRQR